MSERDGNFDMRELILEQAPLLEAFLSTSDVVTDQVILDECRQIASRIDAAAPHPNFTEQAVGTILFYLQLGTSPFGKRTSDIAKIASTRTLLCLGFEFGNENHLGMFLPDISQKLSSLHVLDYAKDQEQLNSSIAAIIKQGITIRNIYAAPVIAQEQEVSTSLKDSVLEVLNGLHEEYDGFFSQ